MSQHPEETAPAAPVSSPAGVTPDLQTLIEAIVDDRVSQALAGLEGKVEDALKRLGEVEENQLTDRCTIVVFSGDFDRLFAAFIIANGAAAMGMEVSIFFTFWGLTAIKKQTIYAGKSVPEKMISMMLPGGPRTVGTSRMNMMGIGPAFFKSLMKKHNVEKLEDLVELAKDMDVRLVACQMSMGIMGISKDELLDDIEYGGVGAYLGDAGDSRMTLFI